MTLMEELAKLTDEQKEKVAAIRSQEDFDAAMKEFGIEASEEDKKKFLLPLTPLQSGELSDEEVAEVAGGSSFSKCPYGIFEFWFPQKACMYDCGKNWDRVKHYQKFKVVPSYYCGYFDCWAYNNIYDTLL